MLGLGIGASATVHALVHGVVLRPLPYRDAERLVWLDHTAPGYGFDRGIGITAWLYVRYSEASRLLEGVALAQSRETTLADGIESPERFRHAAITSSAADVFGVGPELGRWFREGDAPAVVLSHGLWQRRWGGDRGVIGRVLRLGGVEHEVIGVMPVEFAFPDAATELWTGGEFTITHPDGGFNYVAVGRITEAATIEGLGFELQALIEGAPAEYGDHLGIARRVQEGRIQARPVGLRAHVAGDLRATLWLLLGAVVLVLVAAWANVANLFIVRSDARRREVAVRRAMGAGRSAIARLFLAEGVILSVWAWLGGVALAGVAARLIVRYSPMRLPRATEIGVDLHIVSMGLLVSVGVGVALTVIPLLGRERESEVLREWSRGATAGQGRLRLRSVLMAGQVALALMLVAGAGLLVRSWLHVRAASPGFYADDALFLDVGLSPVDYATREEAAIFHEQLAGRIRALPAVRGVSYATCLPLDGYCWGEQVAPDAASAAAGVAPVVVSMRRVSPGFFSALELPLVDGRAFTDAERAARADVVVLSEETAKRLFPDGSPVGRRVAPGDGGPDAQWYTVIGVAADAATVSVMEQVPELVFYLPIRDSGDAGVTIHSMSCAVRTSGDPLAVLPGIRSIVGDLDPDLALANVRTLDAVLADDRAAVSFTTVLLLVAAVVGLMLGALGIYAVVSWVVGRRTAEIGLRLALGARATDVLRIVFRQAGIATAAGLIAGIFAGAVLARLLTSMLHGVRALDGAVFASASLVLILVAAGAAAVPASRAWRLRPVDALRSE
jgi:predicted permease